jgi:hypothetical protein
MPTITAERVSVQWDTKKKMWAISIQIGEEVIRRFEALPRDAGDRALHSLAVRCQRARRNGVRTVRDEGYDVETERVYIPRAEP